MFQQASLGDWIGRADRPEILGLRDLPLDLEGTATATYSPAQGPRWVIDGRIDGDARQRFVAS